jgi:hypothetical protein
MTSESTKVVMNRPAPVTALMVNGRAWSFPFDPQGREKSPQRGRVERT